MACNCNSNCNCNNGAIPEFTSQLSYDGTLFTCPGHDGFIFRPCDDLNQVLNLMMSTICSLLQANALTNQNIGGGAEVYAQLNGSIQEFRTLLADPGVTIVQNANDITFGLSLTSLGGSVGITNNGTSINLEVLSGSGENNTASNLGAGLGLFKQKVGVDLQFKSLVAGEGVLLENNTDDVTINSPCGCVVFFNDEAIDLTLNDGATTVGTGYTIPVAGDGDYLVTYNLCVNQTNSPVESNYYITKNAIAVTTLKNVRLNDVGEADTLSTKVINVMYNGTFVAGDVIAIVGTQVAGTNVVTNQQCVVMRSGI